MPPVISLVTPSFNQGGFLEATIRSVLDQGYPGLEYVVMDGGSCDGSLAIIERYASRLHAWSSAKDEGQYDAINKGFARTSGDIMGWLNSDDLHTPWTLSIVGEIFETFPEVSWLTTRYPMRWDAKGRVVSCTDVRGYSRRGLLLGENLPGQAGFSTWPIQQESTFWRRSLWDSAGGSLDASLDAGADFDLWMRFAKRADPVAVSVPLAGFRRHGDQKTSREIARYEEQAALAFQRSEGLRQPPLFGAFRRFCRDRMPSILTPLATHAGLLHESLICRRSRDNSKWLLETIYV